ncbi:MAG: hypothetical protein ACFWUA_08240 [Sporanaerobacter sp.]|jgi:uncharacterized protein|uniref:radical SAM protein n=1 Tax=Sporanaerobacter sp. TaxID=2010183 RepID=UPI003A0FFB61
MESDIAQKAVDAFMEQVPEDGEASIIFFGGEPLMAYEQIVETSEYTKSNYSGKKKFKFHIVTNATLLNKEKIDFLAENDFSVAVSIDGDWEVQNSQRPLANVVRTLTMKY